MVLCLQRFGFKCSLDQSIRCSGSTRNTLRRSVPRPPAVPTDWLRRWYVRRRATAFDALVPARAREPAWSGIHGFAVTAKAFGDSSPIDRAHCGAESLPPACGRVGNLHRPLTLGEHDHGELHAFAHCALQLHDVEAGCPVARYADHLARGVTKFAGLGWRSSGSKA